MADYVAGSSQVTGSSSGNNNTKVPHPLARPILAALWGAGLLFVGAALTGSAPEWRMLAMAGLAFVVGPVVIELRGSPNGQSIRLPLAHSALFASSLALGASDAAVVGAFAGIGRLVSDSERKPLYMVLYTALKPALVCAGTSLAYTLTGGSPLQPQSVDSLAAVLCAAVVYVSANTLMVGVVDEISGREPNASPKAIVTVVGWLLALLGGYPLASLYAFIPPYVLLAPVIAIALARFAVREPRAMEQLVVEAESTPQETVEEEAQEQDTSEGFVDSATGLASRRYLDMFLSREINRSERVGGSLSVAVFDIGGASGWEEEFGPDGVNAVVAEIGGKLRSGLRDYDLVARYASSRLIVVLPEASNDRAMEVIRRLHRLVISTTANENSLSTSVGVASFPEHGNSAEDLINSAHRALNQGKLLAANEVHSLEELRKAS